MRLFIIFISPQFTSDNRSHVFYKLAVLKIAQSSQKNNCQNLILTKSSVNNFLLQILTLLKNVWEFPNEKMKHAKTQFKLNLSLSNLW